MYIAAKPILISEILPMYYKRTKRPASSRKMEKMRLPDYISLKQLAKQIKANYELDIKDIDTDSDLYLHLNKRYQQQIKRNRHALQTLLQSKGSMGNWQLEHAQPEKKVKINNSAELIDAINARITKLNAPVKELDHIQFQDPELLSPDAEQGLRALCDENAEAELFKLDSEEAQNQIEKKILETNRITGRQGTNFNYEIVTTVLLRKERDKLEPAYQAALSDPNSTLNKKKPGSLAKLGKRIGMIAMAASLLMGAFTFRGEIQQKAKNLFNTAQKTVSKMTAPKKVIVVESEVLSQAEIEKLFPEYYKEQQALKEQALKKQDAEKAALEKQAVEKLALKKQAVKESFSKKEDEIKKNASTERPVIHTLTAKSLKKKAIYKGSYKIPAPLPPRQLSGSVTEVRLVEERDPVQDSLMIARLFKAEIRIPTVAGVNDSTTVTPYAQQEEFQKNSAEMAPSNDKSSQEAATITPPKKELAPILP